MSQPTELCRGCRTVFKDLKSLKSAVRCIICRELFHDHCITGVSSAVVNELKKNRTTLRYVCARDECRATDGAEGPLYSSADMAAVAKRDAEVIFNEKSKEQTIGFKKLADEHKKTLRLLEEKNAIIASMPDADGAQSETNDSRKKTAEANERLLSLEEELAAVKADLVSSRQETAAALNQRRTSLPASTDLTEKNAQIVRLQNELKDLKQQVDNVRNELTTTKGELASAKQQNAQLTSKLAATSKMEEELRTQLLANDSVPSALVKSIEESVAAQMRTSLSAITNMVIEQQQAVNKNLSEFSRQINELRSDKRAVSSTSSSDSKKDPPVTYASVVGGNDPQTIRTVIVNDGNDDQTIVDIQSEHLAGVKRVKKKSKRFVTIQCKDQAAAAETEKILNEKYANRITIRIPKSSPPMVKLVSVPRADSMSPDELLNELRNSNDWLSTDGMVVKQIYTMMGKRRRYGVAIIECTLQTQQEILQQQVILIGLSEVNVYEHVELAQCGNCQSFAHFRSACKAKLACRHCGEEHLIKDCPNKGNKQICVNCKRADYSYDHSPRDHRCRARCERIDGIKSTTTKN